MPVLPYLVSALVGYGLGVWGGSTYAKGQVAQRIEQYEPPVVQYAPGRAQQEAVRQDLAIKFGVRDAYLRRIDRKLAKRKA